MIYRLLFRFTAWWVVPQFKYLVPWQFRQVGKARFAYDDGRPATEVWYRSWGGRWARLKVEVMPLDFKREDEE